MRHSKTTLGVAIAVAFATGIVVSPLLHRAIPDAHAAAAPLTAQGAVLALALTVGFLIYQRWRFSLFGVVTKRKPT